MQTLRRTLFESELLQAVHVRARGSSSAPGELECQSANVLVLPIKGLFAKHDAPRRHVIATPNHALFIASGEPYRISLPGAVGDECITLRVSSAVLTQLMPQTLAADRFDSAAFAMHTLLPPQLVLARSLLWQHIASGAWDALEVELLAIELLSAVLRVAQKGGDA